MKINLLLISLSVEFCHSMGGKRHFEHYAIKIPQPGVMMTPIKQLCCGFTESTCSLQCNRLVKEGFCCTSFSISQDNICNLYDNGPDAFENAPIDNSPAERFYQRRGFQTCEVMLVVGGDDGKTTSNAVELYSPNGLCNYKLAPLPYGLFAGIFVKHYQGQIFVCHGYSNQIPGYDNKRCWKYDFNADAWILMTESAYFHRWRISEMYKDTIYIFDETNPEKYNFKTKEWSLGLSPPVSTGNGPCLIQYKDTMILVGGTNYRKGIQIYNFTSQTWKLLPTSLQQDFQHFGCVLLPEKQGKPLDGPSYQDKILAVQKLGVDNAGIIYDIKNDKILPLPVTNYNHRHNFIRNLGQRVFLVGGFEGSPSKRVEEYHQHNNSWTVAPFNLMVGRWHLVATSVPAAWFKHLSNGCQGVI